MLQQQVPKLIGLKCRHIIHILMGIEGTLSPNYYSVAAPALSPVAEGRLCAIRCPLILTLR